MFQEDIMIPFMKPFVSANALTAVKAVLESGWLGEGPEAALFEREISSYTGARHVNVVNSCTSAIELAIDLMGLKAGDTVISTPMTCAATNIPFVRRGVKIRWADIAADTGNIDPTSIERCLDATIKAIVLVDWGGEPCDHERIRTLATAFQIPVLEDAAHAFGSRYRGTPIGTNNEYVCFSFQAIKTVTGGDGGALTCASMDDHCRARRLRWFGIDRAARKASSPWEYEITEAGYKFHMNDLAASLARANFAHIDWLLSRAAENASCFDSLLSGSSYVSCLRRSADNMSSNWLYTILCEDRNELSEYLLSHGVGCATAHQRNDAYKIFEGCETLEPLLGVDHFSKSYLNLPVGYWVSQADAERICKLIHNFYS